MKLFHWETTHSPRPSVETPFYSGILGHIRSPDMNIDRLLKPLSDTIDQDSEVNEFYTVTRKGLVLGTEDLITSSANSIGL